jgi:hypothetical protein
MNRFADRRHPCDFPDLARPVASVCGGAGVSSIDEPSEEVVRRLEELDDSVFAALEGDAAALDRSVRLWRAVTAEFDPEVVAESREQYLRRAETVWNESRTDPVGSLPRAFAAIEVMNLLAD